MSEPMNKPQKAISDYLDECLTYPEAMARLNMLNQFIMETAQYYEDQHKQQADSEADKQLETEAEEVAPTDS